MRAGAELELEQTAPLLVGMKSPPQYARYHLPFIGRWFVMAGGDTPNVNPHMIVPSQWYAVDFMKVGGRSRRALSKSPRTKVMDFYSWGESVLSPIEGNVKSVIDGLPDNPLGTRDERDPAGNHVILAAASDRYVFIAHLQKGSLEVKPGQRIKVGQEIGK